MEDKKQSQNQETEEAIVEKLDTKKYAFLNEISRQVDENEVNPEDLEILKTQKSWKDLGVPDDLIKMLEVKGFKKPSVVQTKVIKIFQKLSVIAQS